MATLIYIYFSLIAFDVARNNNNYVIIIIHSPILLYIFVCMWYTYHLAGVVCMMKGISFWVVLLLPIATSALDSCPREIVQCSYAADRMQAVDDVRESLVHVVTNIFGTTIDGNR